MPTEAGFFALHCVETAKPSRVILESNRDMREGNIDATMYEGVEHFYHHPEETRGTIKEEVSLPDLRLRYRESWLHKKRLYIICVFEFLERFECFI